MKTFLIVLLLSSGLFLSANAQEQSYVPNARQAVQKSRMQQPQYLELTKDPVVRQQGNLLAAPKSSKENYLLNRPVAIDAPKKRGKTVEESAFVKLANYSKR